MRYLYNLIFYIALPFIILRLLWKGVRAREYFFNWSDRLGFYKGMPLLRTIWIHAVSLGESNAAAPLIKELLRLYPYNKIIVTNMTPTGAEGIRKNFGDKVIQLYVPYDYPGAVKRFLDHFNPKVLLLMETELWPNLLYYTHAKKIPVFLVNARLTARSVRGYKKIKKFSQQMFSCITRIFAQCPRDAEWFRELGVEKSKISMFGNIKFDINVPENVKPQADILRNFWGKDRPIWIAGSTHQGEEDKILSAFAKVLERLPDALLLLVPRHPERFNDVFNLCESQGFRAVKYSEYSTRSCPANVNIILGNVMGKLQELYAVSDLAFVGGTFVPVGGHNVLEPAALAVPIVTGPYLQNISEISQQLLAAKGMVKVNDENELAEQVLAFLCDPELRRQYGTAALEIVMQNKGVTKKILDIIKMAL